MEPINFDLLPNFLIIGAGKSGTTTLYDLAMQHPDIYVPKKKAAEFFDYQYENGLEWYLSSFFSGARGFTARGEASPSYLGHAAPQVASRLREIYQDRPLRLIVTFRDPVSRAYSEYHHWFRLMLENLSFEEALQAERKWFQTNPTIAIMPHEQRRYLYYGHYTRFLKPFLECFSRERFLFLLTEDLGKDFKGTARKMYEFLGVDGGFSPQPVVRNKAENFRSRQLQKSLRRSSDPIRRAARAALQIFPAGLRIRWKQGLLKANRISSGYKPLKPALRKELAPLYRDGIKELETIIERDLSRWYQTE